jgi:hypothetical protein
LSSRPRARWRLAAGVLAVAAGATSATAAIVAVVPDVVQFVPMNVRLNQTESDVRLIAFNEQGNAGQCVRFNHEIHTDQGVIPPNTPLKSHFVHGDPVTALLLTGGVRFDSRIIGVISTSAGLDATDAALGRPGVIYPVPGAELNRGLEPPPQADDYQIVLGGFGLRVTMDVPVDSFSDQIRVLTCCDATCPLALPPDDQD